MRIEGLSRAFVSGGHRFDVFLWRQEWAAAAEALPLRPTGLGNEKRSNLILGTRKIGTAALVLVTAQLAMLIFLQIMTSMRVILVNRGPYPESLNIYASNWSVAHSGVVNLPHIQKSIETFFFTADFALSIPFNSTRFNLSYELFRFRCRRKSPLDLLD